MGCAHHSRTGASAPGWNLESRKEPAVGTLKKEEAKHKVKKKKNFWKLEEEFFK